MLHASYEIWVAIIVVLLAGLWTIRGLIGRKNAKRGCGSNRATFNSPPGGHDIEHRALMFLMTQKTDALLAALARTIEQERQKLGILVRNPSVTGTVDTSPTEARPGMDDRQSSYARILPMAHNGIAVATIARQLQLPEAEVSLVMRLNTA